MPENSMKTGPAPDDPAGRPRREAWFKASSRIAVVAGAFTLVLGVLLVFNSVRLYRGPGNGPVRLVEGRELLPLKEVLREDPNNAALKEELRGVDQRLRQEFFRRQQLAAQGGLLLLGGAVAFVVALQVALFLKRPPRPAPNLSPRPEDPAKTSARAGRAVAATSLALAGLTIALVWGQAKSWRQHAARITTDGTDAAAAPGSPASDPDWFPTPAEVARNWPRFRGPGGAGHAELPGLPESWDGPSGQNILWKTPVPLPGENSPVIWGNRVFVTGADAKRREVYCFDATTGAPLWNQPVSTPRGSRAEPPEVIEDTGFAAPTAVTDGRRVFAIFANGEVAGFEAGGRPLWVRHLGTPESAYGYATSLAMWRNRLIVVFDQGDGDTQLSKILALDAVSGKTVWSTPREVPNSWPSPIVITAGGAEQIITCADPWAVAYDPATGRELWKAEIMSGDVAASPVFANGLVYIASDQECLAALRPDGSGVLGDDKVAWRWDEGDLPDMCSLLCDGPRLYTLVFGVLHAFDALTGEHLWEHDFEAQFQASPTLVNGKLFLLATTGEMIIGEADGKGFRETGRAKLGEKCGASPAFAPGRLYLRGKKHLYCIGAKDGN